MQEDQEKQTDNSGNPVLWTCIIVTAIACLCFAIFYFDSKWEMEALQKVTRQQGQIVINIPSLIDLNQKTLIDTAKIEGIIQKLGDRYDRAIDRGEILNQYNLDRLNLFLTLGIGILAVIGGLLPLATNFISTHDFKSKIVKLKRKVALTEGKVKDLDVIRAKIESLEAKTLPHIRNRVAQSLKASKNAEQLSAKINLAADKLPIVLVLVLQRPLDRLLTNEAVFEGKGGEPFLQSILRDLVEDLKALKDETMDTKSEALFNREMHHFAQGINGLRVRLFTRFQDPQNLPLLEKFIEAIRAFDYTTGNTKQKMDNLISTIDGIIQPSLKKPVDSTGGVKA